jgi:hypothetical protein
MIMKMMLAAPLLMLIGETALAETPNPDQQKFIDSLMKVMLASRLCGFTPNAEAIAAAAAKVGIAADDTDGRFSEYTKHSTAVLVQQYDEVKNIAPPDVLCGGWLLNFGAYAPIASQRNWLVLQSSPSPSPPPPSPPPIKNDLTKATNDYLKSLGK